MGTLSVFLGFAWWVELSAGKADAIGLYLSRVSYWSLMFLPVFLGFWMVGCVWILYQIRNKDMSKKDGFCVAVAILAIRLFSLGMSTDLPGLWGDHWFSFVLMAIPAILALLAGFALGFALLMESLGLGSLDCDDEPTPPPPSKIVTLIMLALLYV